MAEPTGRAGGSRGLGAVWRCALLALALASLALCVPAWAAYAADTGTPPPSAAQAGPAQATLSAQDDAELAQRQQAAQQERALADAAARNGDAAAWEQHLRKVLVLSPEPGTYLELIYGLQARHGLDHDCEPLWRELLTRFPDAQPVLVARARELIKAGQYSAAREVLQRALSQAPGDPAPYFWLGVCAEYTVSPEAALPYYQRAVEQDYSAAHVAALARVVGRLSGADAEEVVWEKQLLAHPDDAALYFEHGVRVLLSDGQRAFDDFSRCVSLKPDHPEYLRYLVRAQQHLGAHEACAELLRQLVQLEPAPRNYADYTECLLSLGRMTEALTVCEEGLTRFPAEHALALAKYLVLRESKQTEQAYAYAVTVGTAQDDSKLFSVAGQNALHNNDSEQARQIYNAFRQELPSAALQDAGCLTWMISEDQVSAITAGISGFRQLEDQSAYFQAVLSLSYVTLASANVDLIFSSLIEADPHCAYLYETYAWRLFGGKRFGEALAVARRGMNDAQAQGQLRVLEAICVANISGWEAAEPMIAVLRADPQATAGEYASLLCYMPRTTNSGWLIELGLEGQQRWPQDQSLAYWLAKTCLRTGEYAAALAALQSPALQGSIDGIPVYYELTLLLGQAYCYLGNYTKAVAFLKPWADDPDDGATARALLARAYYFANEMNEARSVLQQVPATGSPATAANTWRGLVQLKAGEVEAARQSFAQVRAVEHAAAADLAWCALGEARAALAVGDKPAASALLSEAAGYGVRDDALYSEIDATRKELQR